MIKEKYNLFLNLIYVYKKVDMFLLLNFLIEIDYVIREIKNKYLI